jgi:hypothetical protein
MASPIEKLFFTNIFKNIIWHLFADESHQVVKKITVTYWFVLCGVILFTKLNYSILAIENFTFLTNSCDFLKTLSLRRQHRHVEEKWHRCKQFSLVSLSTGNHRIKRNISAKKIFFCK